MKRAADPASVFPVRQRSHRTEADSTETDIDALHVPEGRSSRDRVRLDRLWVFEEGVTMKAIRQHLIRANKGAAEVQVALDLIETLDASDNVPDTTSAIVDIAVQILLLEKQGPLLCRLAAKLPLHKFVLDIGNNSVKAATVAAMAQGWPKDSRVVLNLSAALPDACVKALHPFLVKPDLLCITIQAAFTQDVKALFEALRLRQLNSLAIVGSPLVPELLEALRGVLTDGISLEIVQPGKNVLESFVSSLVSFVEKSGAHTLDIGWCKMDGSTSARLLACRQNWQYVSVRLSTEVSGLLSQGRHTIGRLELHAVDETFKAALDFAKRLSSAEAMHWLHLCKVSMLVAHGPVDLVTWVEEMDRYTSSHHIPRLLETLEAGFVKRDAGDLEAALVSLEQGGRVVSVVCRASLWSGGGYKPLDASTEHRLRAMSARNTMARHTQGQEEALRAAVEQAWKGIVDDLAAMLSADRPMQHVLEYLSSIGVTVSQPVGALLAEYTQSTGLEVKLLLLETASKGTLPSIVAARLQGHPHEMGSMMKTLIEWRLLARERPVEEWRELGVRYRHAWALGEGPEVDESPLEAIPPFVRPPAVEPRTVPSPTAVAACWALTEPSTQAGYDSLVRSLLQCRNQLDRVAADSDAGVHERRRHARNAINLILRAISPGQSLSPINSALAVQVARHLLGLGQGKWLGHMLPARPRWALVAVAPKAFNALADLTPWPSAKAECELVMSAQVPAEYLEQLVAFAKGVPPDMLSLSMRLEKPVAAKFWDAVVNIVASRPGLRLQVEWAGQVGAWLDGWKECFQRIEGLPVRCIGLMNFSGADGSVLSMLSPALIQMVLGSGAAHVELNGCGTDLMRQVLACRTGWESVQVPCSQDAVDLFKQEPVKLQTLKIWLPSAEDHPKVEEMIASCKDLERVEVFNTPVDVASLARGLQKSRSVLSVKFRPALSSAEGEQEAYALLWQNPWLIDMEVLPPSNGAPQTERDFVARVQWEGRLITDRNRIRDSALSRVGVGAGWGAGATMKPALTQDTGAHAGGYLNWQAARALRWTSKAAYVASQQAWRMEVDRLADLLAPGVSFEKFAQGMAKRIEAWNLGGSTPVLRAGVVDDHAGMVLDKILGFRRSGVHDSMIVLVLRCRLARLSPPPSEDGVSKASNASNSSQARAIGAAVHPDSLNGQHLRALLEGLAYLNRIPAKTWLEEGLGVKMPVPGMNGP